MKLILTITMFALTINAYSQKLVKEYYDWGKTKIKREYYTDAYGTLNGSYKAYSEYGGIMKQGQCKDDGPIGKWTENYDNGKLHYIKFYDTPGTYDFQVKDGKIISYYEDGKTIKYERNFKNMKLDGVWKEYDEKGTITKEGKYVDGVFEPTGITKIKDDEEKEKEKQLQATILLQKAEEYKKIIPEADKAFLEKDYPNALILYKSASDLMGTDKYSDENISELIDTCLMNRDYLYDYWNSQFDSIKSEYIKQTKEYKLVVLQLQPGYSYSSSYQYQYDRMRDKPCWQVAVLNKYSDYDNDWENVKKCFNENRNFYETFQIAFIECALNYWTALKIEKGKVEKSSYDFYYKTKNTTYQFYNYDKDKFFENIKEAKRNYELGKSVRVLHNTVVEKKNQINTLNDQNKKKTLLKKYLIVYEDLIAKYNTYPSLTEIISLLTTINNISDKVIAYYSQDTKELEKKLKDAETVDQIKSILLGQ